MYIDSKRRRSTYLKTRTKRLAGLLSARVVCSWGYLDEGVLMLFLFLLVRSLSFTFLSALFSDRQVLSSSSESEANSSDSYSFTVNQPNSLLSANLMVFIRLATNSVTSPKALTFP